MALTVSSIWCYSIDDLERHQNFDNPGDLTMPISAAAATSWLLH